VRIIRELLDVVGDETRKEVMKNYNDIGIEKIVSREHPNA